MSEPNWVTPEELIDVNVEIVADSGDEHGVLKRNELDSACWKPRHLWIYGGEDKIVTLAVALLAGIIQNHPFIEGNKRTALVGARTLLIRNSYDLDAPDTELGPLVKSFAAGHLAKDEVEEAFERYLVTI